MWKKEQHNQELEKPRMLIGLRKELDIIFKFWNKLEGTQELTNARDNALRRKKTNRNKWC